MKIKLTKLLLALVLLGLTPLLSGCDDDDTDIGFAWAPVFVVPLM